MDFKLQTVIAPMRRHAALLVGGADEGAHDAEQATTTTAVVLGILVVAGFALLMSMV